MLFVRHEGQLIAKVLYGGDCCVGITQEVKSTVTS